jgi:hypothetical protein
MERISFGLSMIRHTKRRVGHHDSRAALIEEFRVSSIVIDSWLLVRLGIGDRAPQGLHPGAYDEDQEQAQITHDERLDDEPELGVRKGRACMVESPRIVVGEK